MSKWPSVIRQTMLTPIILIVVLLVMAALSYQFGTRAFNRTAVEMFINIMVVVGLYVFVGNSGLLSFGHISFMCLGAYMTAWLAIPPVMKSITLKGLPAWLLHTQLPMWVATPISGVFAALFALVVGRVIMRLSGIAASIATFGTARRRQQRLFELGFGHGRTRFDRRHPADHERVDRLARCRRLRSSIAYLYAISRSGLALRATRDESVAASASGIDIVRERLIAFVVSAFIIGIAGALYAHFLSIVNPGAFYLRTTFITLSMLVVGGMYSLSGAVTGVVTISVADRIVPQPRKGHQPWRTHGRTAERGPGDRDRHHHHRHPDVPADRPHPQPGVLLARLADAATLVTPGADGDEGTELKFTAQLEEWLCVLREY